MDTQVQRLARFSPAIRQDFKKAFTKEGKLKVQYWALMNQLIAKKTWNGRRSWVWTERVLVLMLVLMFLLNGKIQMRECPILAQLR
jgi:hypothetical protein